MTSTPPKSGALTQVSQPSTSALLCPTLLQASLEVVPSGPATNEAAVEDGDDRVQGGGVQLQLSHPAVQHGSHKGSRYRPRGIV